MYNGVIALDLCKNFVQNFVSAQYLENELIELTKSCMCINVDMI